MNREIAESARALHAPYPRARRVLFFGLVSATTLLGSLMMLDIVRAAGISALEVGILALFVPTFAWIAIAFWNAAFGFALLLAGRDPLSLERVRDAGAAAPLRTRTALVMPAHNEDPERLIRALESMVLALEATGHGGGFDVHLLSDTTDPAAARAEEDAWAVLRRRVPRPERLRYRRRPANVGRKAGNIGDFCAAHGARYDFLVVLDADSVMGGETLVELVRTMEANPRVGLIQTVPIPARQKTAFGRFIQFAGALYSPMLAAGQSFWQTDVANYWGHNAILRTAPFMEHCRLPVLSGSPPLGGAILSHDFVEAALLRRAGWLCYLLPALGGSYEEVPANALDFAKRDRRWAQGSLQHLRLLGERGLHPLSRLHFVLGAMGYISSVLWLLMLLASTAYVVLGVGPSGWLADWSLGGMSTLFPLLGLTAFVLFAPKAFGLLLAMFRQRRAFGGTRSLLLSWGLETLFSVVIAPVMMFYHVRSVLEILGGRDVKWGVQEREGYDVSWRDAGRATAAIVACGAAWAGFTLYASPVFFLWLLPIFVGLLLSPALVGATSRTALGGRLRRLRLLLVPSETSPPAELRSSGRKATTNEVYSDTSRKVIRSMYEAERGLFDLRRGRPLCVTGTDDKQSDEALLLAAVESLDVAAFARLRRLGSGAIRLVVTAERARSMGLLPAASNGDDPAGGVSMALDAESPEQVFQLASARASASRIVPAGVRPATELEAAGLALTRLGRMLPAIVCVSARLDGPPELREALESGAMLRVSAAQIVDMVGAPGTSNDVRLVSSAPVPLGEDENARFMLFREANGLLEHVAILIGDRERWPDPVPTRLHSACLTGDLFGSLRCDCGEQLKGSLAEFEASGGGVLLYMAQEGRGIGLGNKLRAYALQQQGLDTVDADSVLGFRADERRYAAAVSILHELGIRRVRLLTNNPEKVRALEDGGIQVISRTPLHGTLNRHNLPYVRAKVQRAGHWLGDMLHGGRPGGS